MIECIPKKELSKCQSLKPKLWPYLEIGIFIHIVNLEWCHISLVCPNPVTGILTKRKERRRSEQTQPERIPSAYKRGGWSHVSTREGRPGYFQHQKLGSFLLVFEGFTAWPIPWLQTSSPPKRKRINFCFFKHSTSVSVCYRHPRKLKIVYIIHLEPASAWTRRCYHVYYFSLHSDKKQLRRWRVCRVESTTQ